MKSIEKIQDAIEIGTTSSSVWFRGHSNTYTLTPGIFRQKLELLEQIQISFGRATDFRIEHLIIEEFIRRAPSLEKNLPQKEDYLSWLFFMQHHGVPTRLLDWTESILVALYFAVYKEPKSDGEIWVLSPHKLNELNNNVGYSMPTPNNRIVKFLADEPMHTNPAELAKNLNIEVPNYPLALRTPMAFSRIVNQRGTFTIHPKPKKGFTLTEILNDEKGLARYIVPCGCKDQLRRDLAKLGINHVTLFPSLDSLSKTIIDELYDSKD